MSNTEMKVDEVNDKIYKGKTFCHIINQICDPEKCDVYPCDGNIAFYNVPIDDEDDINE